MLKYLLALVFFGHGMAYLSGFLASWTKVFVYAPAILSAVVILLWWNSVPFGAKLGAAFDVLILVAYLSPLRQKIML